MINYKNLTATQLKQIEAGKLVIELETKAGWGVFVRYKQGNFKGKNVRVLLRSEREARWFKEKDIVQPKVTKDNAPAE